MLPSLALDRCYYQVGDVCGGELPDPLPLAVLDGVDVEVDRAVEGGQQVAEAGHVGQPGWPGQLSLNVINETIFVPIGVSVPTLTI